jgi:hypothetical protein
VVIASTSRTPTGAMAYDPAVSYPDEDAMLADVRANSRHTYVVDALNAAEALFGSTEVANLILVGAAYQAGALPLSARSIEHAIDLFGVAVAANRAAFRRGRVAVADPVRFAAALAPAPSLSTVEEIDLQSELGGETRRTAGRRATLVRDHSVTWPRGAISTWSNWPGGRIGRPATEPRSARPSPAGRTASAPTRTSTRSPASSPTRRRSSAHSPPCPGPTR